MNYLCKTLERILSAKYGKPVRVTPEPKKGEQNEPLPTSNRGAE